MEVSTTGAGANSGGRKSRLPRAGESSGDILALPAAPAPASEEEFAELVDTLVADPNRHDQLTDLLREDHPSYNERGAATVAQMRGWVLLGLARTGVSDHALLFVLEELDTGIDPYLVAAAACALRSYAKPNPALAPFVIRALKQNRYRDDPVSFLAYADYSLGPSSTSPVRELLLTLAWLGPYASSVLPEIESIVKSGGLSKKASVEANRTLEIIRGSDQIEESDCCKLPVGLINKFSWPGKARRSSESIGSTVFEDQNGVTVTYNEFFQARPSIVVFFYTRCDNPLKCSLTVTKLARVQKLLESRNLDEQIQTAAITYDPAFDLPQRIRSYGERRSVRFDAFHRMLRATNGLEFVKQHFKLGVNFIESLVNRHRIEVYILDAKGRIAASFERLHWDEQEVVDRATELLKEKVDEVMPNVPSELGGRRVRRKASPIFGTLAALGVAFFPKCPICWSAYMSMFGIAGLHQVPYSPWLQPVLAAVMLINLASVWFRGRSTSRMTGFYLVSAGALAIIVSKIGIGWEGAAVWGVALTLAGSLISSLRGKKRPNSSTKLINFQSSS